MSDPIFEAREMEDKSPADQAALALRAILDRIAKHPGVGWYCGLGTQTFALLTEAYATLLGQSVRETREQFAPRKAANPEPGASDPASTGAAEIAALRSENEGLRRQIERMRERNDDLLAGDLRGTLGDLPQFDRRPALRLIQSSFCNDCAEPITGGPCFCKPRRGYPR